MGYLLLFIFSIRTAARMTKHPGCNSVYREGELSIILLNENYLVFTRSSGNKKIITFANNSSTSVNLVLKSKTTELISGRKSNQFNVEPESAIVFLQGKNDTFEF